MSIIQNPIFDDVSILQFVIEKSAREFEQAELVRIELDRIELERIELERNELERIELEQIELEQTEFDLITQQIIDSKAEFGSSSSELSNPDTNFADPDTNFADPNTNFVFEGQKYESVPSFCSSSIPVGCPLSVETIEQIVPGLEQIVRTTLDPIIFIPNTQIEIWNVLSDGKCLGHAIELASTITDCLCGQKCPHSSELVDFAVEYSKLNPIDGFDYIHDSGSPEFDSLIPILTQCLQINIIVLSVDMPGVPIIYPYVDSMDCILLFNANGHFMFINVLSTNLDISDQIMRGVVMSRLMN